jgi:protoporphyrinogen oxidase
MKNIKHVVIFGGGFTGLRIAYLLHLKGVRITIVEKTSKLGGMVQTFSSCYERDAYLFDYGPHLFFKEYVTQYRELIGSDLLALTDCFRMATGSTLLTYPLKMSEFLLRVPLHKTVTYVFDFMIHRLGLAQREVRHLDDLMTARFGRKLFDDFYAAYIEKCVGLPPSEIDPLWGRERENVSGKSLIHNVMNKIWSAISEKAARKLQAVNDPAAKVISAYYPRLGAGQICDAMVRILPHESIKIESAIDTLRISNGRITEVIIRNGEERIALTADYYVSTIPLQALLLACPDTPVACRDAVTNLNYRKMRLVNLILDTPRIMDCLEIFSMDSTQIYKRVYEPKAMSPAMAPDGRTSLCAEVCYNDGDLVSIMSEEQLISRCVDDLVRGRVLAQTVKVLKGFVVEMPNAYPVYDLQAVVQRDRALAWISELSNLLTCGRQGLYRYHAMTNEAMEMADSVVSFFDGSMEKHAVDSNRSKWGKLFY